MNISYFSTNGRKQKYQKHFPRKWAATVQDIIYQITIKTTMIQCTCIFSKSNFACFKVDTQNAKDNASNSPEQWLFLQSSTIYAIKLFLHHYFYMILCYGKQWKWLLSSWHDCQSASSKFHLSGLWCCTLYVTWNLFEETIKLWNPRLCSGHQKAQVWHTLACLVNLVNIFLQLSWELNNPTFPRVLATLLHSIISNFVIPLISKSDQHPISPHNITQNQAYKLRELFQANEHQRWH